MSLPITHVNPSENLSRFLFSDSLFSRTANRVKYAAFKPPRNYPLELSVYRVNGLTEQDIWGLAAQQVETKERKTKARADLLCQDVLDVPLEVRPDPMPHCRHANITGWKEEDLENLDFAVRLASIAVLVIKQ